jgi:hypothetical protein
MVALRLSMAPIDFKRIPFSKADRNYAHVPIQLVPSALLFGPPVQTACQFVQF